MNEERRTHQVEGWGIVVKTAKPTRLGKVVKARREELGLTQEELVARMNTLGDGIRQSELSKIERGSIGRPRDLRLSILAAALGLQSLDLLERAGWFGARTHLDAAEAGAILPEQLLGPGLELLNVVAGLPQPDVYFVLELAQRLKRCRETEA